MNPRIGPLPRTEWDDFLARVMEGSPGGGLNIFATLARHPALFQGWLGFGAVLLFDGTLSARDRELAILRTAHNRRCDYEWVQHVRLARQAGLDDAEIEAVRLPLGHYLWAPSDRRVLDAVDELNTTGDLADETWSGLTQHYDERQLIELLMLVGHYEMLAVILNTLRVPLEN